MLLSACASIEAREGKVEGMIYKYFTEAHKILLKQYVKVLPLNGRIKHHVH
jgi:hypothetical protein